MEGSDMAKLAKPTCMTCRGTEFSVLEMKHKETRLDDIVVLIYCTGCGHIVGTSATQVAVSRVIDPVRTEA